MWYIFLIKKEVSCLCCQMLSGSFFKKNNDNPLVKYLNCNQIELYAYKILGIKIYLPWKSHTIYHTNLQVLQFYFCHWKTPNFLFYFSTIKIAFLKCPVCISQLSRLYFSTVQFVFLTCPICISQLSTWYFSTGRWATSAGLWSWLFRNESTRSSGCCGSPPCFDPAPHNVHHSCYCQHHDHNCQHQNHHQHHRGWPINYAFADREGVSLQMIIVLHRGVWPIDNCQGPM